MSERNGFWKALQSKLERPSSREADRKFWAAFEKENPTHEKIIPWFMNVSRWFRIPSWVPIAISLLLVAGVWWHRAHVEFEQEEVLSDLEFYTDFDTVDVLLTSEGNS